jgi:hypothetical protein
VYQRIPQSVNLAINAWLKTITGGWGLGGGGEGWAFSALLQTITGGWWRWGKAEG